MSISGLLDRPFGNFCFSYIKLFFNNFSVCDSLLTGVSKVKVLKLIIKIGGL